MSPTRRQLLASVMGGLMSGVAGCGGVAGPDSAPTDSPSAAPVPTTQPGAGGPVTTVVAFDGLGPVNLTIAPNGDVYMAMGVSGQIRRLPAARTDETDLATDATELVATLDAGNGFVYALDILDGVVYAAVNSRQTPTHGVWQLPLDDGTPTRLAAFDPGVRLRALLADAGRDRLLVSHARQGVVSTVQIDNGSKTRWLDHRLLDADIRGPSGLTQADGTVYVSNNEFGRVVGVPVGSDGTAGPPSVVVEDPALLSGASGLAIDDESLYVAVANLNRVVQVEGDDIQPLASGRDGLSLPTDVVRTPDGTALFVVNFGFEQMVGLTGNPSLMRVPL